MDQAGRGRTAGPRRQLASLHGCTSTDRTDVARSLGALPKAIEKAVWEAISVRDPEAPVIADRKGNPEADPDIRDNENVLLPARSRL